MKRLFVRRVLLGLAVPAVLTTLRSAAGRLQAQPGHATTGRRLDRVADGVEQLLGGRRSSRRAGAWGGGRRGRTGTGPSSPTRW